MEHITIDTYLIEKSCEYFDQRETTTVAMEECAELIQCISKELRGKDNKVHMEEEIGDVLIAISDLIYLYGLEPKRIQRWINFKQNRQSERIKGGNGVE